MFVPSPKIFGKKIIDYLIYKNVGEDVRQLGLDGENAKKGTPTMGGLLILIGLFTSVFLWSDLKNPYNWLLIFITFSFGLLGALDDYKKIKNKNSYGISSKFKFIIQIIIGLISLIILYKFIDSELTNNLYFPYPKVLVMYQFYFLHKSELIVQ